VNRSRENTQISFGNWLLLKVSILDQAGIHTDQCLAKVCRCQVQIGQRTVAQEAGQICRIQFKAVENLQPHLQIGWSHKRRDRAIVESIGIVCPNSVADFASVMNLLHQIKSLSGIVCRDYRRLGKSPYLLGRTSDTTGCGHNTQGQQGTKNKSPMEK